jgi:hypothetical protein
LYFNKFIDPPSNLVVHSKNKSVEVSRQNFSENRHYSIVLCHKLLNLERFYYFGVFYLKNDKLTRQRFEPTIFWINFLHKNTKHKAFMVIRLDMLDF